MRREDRKVEDRRQRYLEGSWEFIQSKSTIRRTVVHRKLYPWQDTSCWMFPSRVILKAHTRGEVRWYQTHYTCVTSHFSSFRLKYHPRRRKTPVRYQHRHIDTRAGSGRSDDLGCSASGWWITLNILQNKLLAVHGSDRQRDRIGRREWSC